MERKYIAVRTIGNPEYVLDRIRQAVQSENRTRIIPAVKFERRARGEFYFFLAMEGQGIDFLDLTRTIFAQWNLPGNIIPALLTPDEIKSMVSRTELETHSLNALTYKSLWSSDFSDPFDLSDTFSYTESTSDTSLRERYDQLPHWLSANAVSDTSLGERRDQLLHWLSANAEGTWQTFVRICSVLALADDVKVARSIFKRLTLLGHIESSENGQNWSICPTALVQYPTDQDVYILTGQQTPMLIEYLKGHFDVETLPQPNYQGPSCVKVNGIFTDDVSLNGFHLVHARNISVQLAQLLPDLEIWKDILPAMDQLSTTTYNIEIWNGRQFAQCDKFYERHGKYFGESGMYRLTKKAENNPYQIVLYFDEPNQRWLRGDWYGLRFLTYNSAGRKFEVKYDSSTNELIIPVEEHWPLLYERALVLASGMLPARDKNFRWLKYTNISNELVQLLTEKLNITITEV